MNDDLRYPLILAAQEIVQEPDESRDRLLAEAIALLVGEVDAGVKNRADFPRVTAEMFARLANPKPRMYAVPDPPKSLAVPESETWGWSVRVPREGQ